MSDASTPTSRDIAEHVARILHSNEETKKFVAEQRMLMTEAAKLERGLVAPLWPVIMFCFVLGAVLFGAGMVFGKLFGG